MDAISKAFVNSLLPSLKLTGLVSGKQKPLDQVLLLHLKSIAKDEQTFETRCAEKTIEHWVKQDWQKAFEPCESKVISKLLTNP